MFPQFPGLAREPPEGRIDGKRVKESVAAVKGMVIESLKDATACKGKSGADAQTRAVDEFEALDWVREASGFNYWKNLMKEED